MAESRGTALRADAQSSAGVESDSDLTSRRIRSAARNPVPQAATSASAPEASEMHNLAAGLDRMRSNANLFGFAITARRRMLGARSLKRLLRRLQAQLFARQSAFNEAATQVLSELARAEHGARQAVRVQAQALTAAQTQIGDLQSRLAGLRADNTTLRERLDRQQVTLAAQSDDGEPPSLDYLGHQARFRGDDVEIAERQRGYLTRFAGQQDVLDVGCGRGEFLALLRDAGISARGVDADLDMVKACAAQGLDVAHGDGIAYLRTLPDASLGGIFAAQVIEHLQPARIVIMMQLALRKLRPNGVLVLETVNPATVVALTNFYLDFTHVKPIHPLALEWLAESLEFADCELLYLSPVGAKQRLQELPDGAAEPEAVKRFNEALAATNDVLYGPRDYALVARRP